jgi:Protein of unknown function (DUF2934)
MTVQTKKDLPSKEGRIRNLAYMLWMEDGCPEGRDQAHWLEAEEMLLAEDTDPNWLVREVKDVKPAVTQPKPDETFIKRQGQKAA